MKCKNVLNKLIQQGPCFCTPMLKHLRPGLHALILSSGLEVRENERYDWNGQQRGSRGHALFQYTLEGEGRLDYEGRVVAVQPGQGLVLSIPHNHRYWLPEGGRWKFLFITFFGRESVRLLRHVAQLHNGILTLPRSHKLVQHAAQTILDLNGGQLTSTATASARAYELTMQILETGQEQAGRQEPETIPESIQLAKAFFRQHLSHAVGVTEMADAAGLTRSHFSRLFKSVTGHTPMNFIIRERMQRAQLLIQTTPLPLAQVATQCGYADPAYFIRVFRHYYDLDPQHLRLQQDQSQP